MKAHSPSSKSNGQSVILAVWEYQAGGTPMTDIRWLAYMLATVYHECATRMWPTTEYGSQSYLEGKEYYPYVGRRIRAVDLGGQLPHRIGRVGAD